MQSIKQLMQTYFPDLMASIPMQPIKQQKKKRNHRSRQRRGR